MNSDYDITIFLWFNGIRFAFPTRSKIWRAVSLRFGLAVITDENEQSDCQICVKMTPEGPGMQRMRMQDETRDRCLATSASNKNARHRLCSQRRRTRDEASRHMYLFRCWQKNKSYWHDLSPKHLCWHSKWLSQWMSSLSYASLKLCNEISPTRGQKPRTAPYKG